MRSAHTLPAADGNREPLKNVIAQAVPWMERGLSEDLPGLRVHRAAG
jgi:hypothetical protein